MKKDLGTQVLTINKSLDRYLFELRWVIFFFTN